MLLAASIPFASASAQSTQHINALVETAKSSSAQPQPTTGAPVAPSAIQTASPTANETSAVIGAIQIDGRSETRVRDFAAVIEQHLGEEGRPEALSNIAASIANVAREQGFIFASAMIPPQSLHAGLLRIKLDEGRVDEVRIIGSDNRRLHSILMQLRGRVGTRRQVERRLLLAEDLPGITILQTRFVREQENGVLVVEVRDGDAGYIGLDNYGPDANGPIRARVSYDLAGLLNDGDLLSVQIIDTVAQPRELAYGSARYSMVIDDRGNQAGIYAAMGRSHPGARLRRFDLRGRIWQLGAFTSHPLVRSNARNVWLNGDINILGLSQRASALRIQRDRIVTASMTVTGSVRLDEGWLYGGVGVTQGLGVAGTTGEHDPLASRYDGSASFTKGVAWFSGIGELTDRLSFRVAANGQLASRPLLAAQEIALGGPYYGRAYDFSERTGDSGVLGSIELRRQFSLNSRGRRLQLYTFADGGIVDNLRDGFGGGSLASAGGGIRLGLGKLDMSLETAIPLSAPRYESDDKSPKINASIGFTF